MREILFRGKRCDNGEWVYGACCPDAKYKDVICFIRYYDKKTMQMTEIDIETRGQFTGLCDKNGTKIFEGDIVRWENVDDYGEVHKSHNHEILFDDKYFYSFVASRDYGRDVFTKIQFSFNDIRKNNIEVIGNIYDNPELLEGE